MAVALLVGLLEGPAVVGLMVEWLEIPLWAIIRIGQWPDGDSAVSDFGFAD